MTRVERALWAVAFVAVILAGIWWDGHRAAMRAAQPKIETASDNAAARSLEAQGGQAVQAQTDALLRQAISTQEKTNALVDDVRSDPATRALLSPAAGDRLRAHDRVLCDTDPAACDVAPAPAGDAGQRR